MKSKMIKINDKLVEIDDTTPTGAQILLASGVRDIVEYVLFQKLKNGLLEEIRPEESTQLDKDSIETFLLFKSDRTYRFTLDGKTFDWGAPNITGATIKSLANIELSSNDVWLELQNEKDRLISDHEYVDLTSQGVERLYTQETCIEIIVNARAKNVNHRILSYWQVVKLAFEHAENTESSIYSIDYANGPIVNPEGAMVDGQHVQLTNGMVFYVTQTDKS
ncbi:multiubiquitin domain-containing protein [Pantoea sp. Mb-10]|uniref:multiubiquitin domain-containing protein n=1 Tax=unclassified Pantoea TaxID=2630326 RepID=UPI001E3CBDC9|nr:MULTISPECIES: multiubiquitin domain-containing protein [unclassified Pantoea]MCE0490333.1 multiubiquitin domain-containing protein [Pantoea sp. Mb-10]MCE0501464.1 multiubiquitin domain-containing protein [Pantoea sp. Pb-8]